MDKDLIKTGTTTIGIMCKDVIILASDKRTTLGGRIVSNKNYKKIEIINDDIAVTTAGLVSDIQLLTKILRAQLKLNELRKGRKSTVNEAANLLGSLIYSNIRKMSLIQAITGFILAGRDDNGLYLYELGVDGAVMKVADYAADGSGMMFALGVLEAQYKKNISINEGMKLAVTAINAALQRDTATGDGIDIIAITKDGVKEMLSKEIETKLTI